MQHVVGPIEIPCIGFNLTTEEVSKLMLDLDIKDFKGFKSVIEHIAKHLYDITEEHPLFFHVADVSLSGSQKTLLSKALMESMVFMGLSPARYLWHKFYESDSSLIRTTAKLLISESNDYGEMPADLDIVHASKLLVHIASNTKYFAAYRQRVYNSECAIDIITKWDKVISPSRKFGVTISESFIRSMRLAAA
jgi:hypothetical protein